MCTRPLKGFKYGKTQRGKDNYVIRSYAVDHIEISPRGDIINVFEKAGNYCNKIIREFVEIPCGKCLECKLDYSRQWANRCMLEAQSYEKNCFITLTYNDDNLPKSKFVKEVYLNGEIKDFGESMTLRKRDFQLFMKRLRKMFPDVQIRYFACGEYGSKTKRPHYHAILFNWIPEDLVQIGANKLNQIYYSSLTLEKLWPYGFNLVAECTWDTCAYVARYVAKKVGVTDDNIYRLLNIDKEFILMSRRPGIGSNWYNQNNVCYANFTKNYISTKDGPITITPNKYFDKLLEAEDPEKLDQNKMIRKEFAEHKKKIELESTTLPYWKYLQVKNENLEVRTKSLKRKGDL